jgi:hypothetical protein
MEEGVRQGTTSSGSPARRCQRAGVGGVPFREIGTTALAAEVSPKVAGAASIRCWTGIPQGLKPVVLRRSFGMAEAMP